MLYDVIIIGGGAAGMCAAVKLKKNNAKLSVLLLEGLDRLGKKLITTGNGRCNILNSDRRILHYHGENTSFAETALSRYGRSETEAFFEELGVPFVYDETGRAYPYSLQASSVVDAFRFSLEELKVEVKTNFSVTDIKKERDGFTVGGTDGKFRGRAVLLAAGLYSGGDKVGSNGSVFRLLKGKGYKTVKLTPAIVQIKTEPQTVRSLKGIKVNAVASLVGKDGVLRSEYGEVLFCDYGLSGPPILQISRAVERTDDTLCVALDLIPECKEEKIFYDIDKRAELLKERPLELFFNGWLNKRVGQAIIKECGLSLSDTAAKLTEKDKKALAALIKAWRFKVTGTTGFLNSQVTAGGIAVSDFSSKTLMSKRDTGLFAAGELLDIDGDCGGFNLAWAWSSAMLAADSITEFLGE